MTLRQIVMRVTHNIKICHNIIPLPLMCPCSRFGYFCRLIVICCIFANGTSKILNSEPNEEFVPRVVNGWPAALGDVPYQVAFKGLVSRRTFTYKTFCGGTIIGPNKILSAAHCFVEDRSECLKIFMKIGHVRQKDLRHKYAVAGTLLNTGHKPKTDDTVEGQWRMLKEVRYPRRYKFPRKDIAIVLTTAPFNYSNNVNPIPFASRYSDYHGKCLVSGYGRITSVGKATSDKLLLAHLDIVPLFRCSRQHRRNMLDFVCTSSVITDVGKGDSGGPLVCMNTGDPNEGSKGVLVGVVSGHRQGVGSFFTRVSSYYKYIRKNGSRSNKRNCKLFVILIMLIYNPFLPF